MLAMPEWISVVPGSACRPFLDPADVELDAEDRWCDALRFLRMRVGGETRSTSERDVGMGGRVSTAPVLGGLVSMVLFPL